MIVVVPVDPPREGLSLSALSATAPITDAEACRLYEASVTDVVSAVEQSGGDLLVNYRDKETLPEGVTADDPESELSEWLTDVLEDDDVRLERQVGSTRSARIGNTVTHLLKRENASAVGVLEPTVPLVRRGEIDSTAMALRRHEVVLGPGSAGGTYLSAYTKPIDFTDAYTTPSLSTLARQSAGADCSLGFAPMLPTLETADGLRETMTTLEARAIADRPGGSATAAVLDEIAITIGTDGTLERDR